jgi:protein-tyrosine phosphatase
MAERLLKKKLKELGREDVEVSSAGVVMLGGSSASKETAEVLAKEGIDVSDHLSQALSKWLIKRSDIILAMEKAHEDIVLQMSAEAKNRVFLLKEFAKIDDNNLHIEDPIGKSREFYERTMAVIKEAVEKVSKII